MKFTIAVALCCATHVFGLGMPNPALAAGIFHTVPPWQYASTSPNILLGNAFGSLAPPAAFTGLQFVVPPTFSQSAKQYRRSVDWQNEATYIPLNNYVLLTNADLSAVTPRSTVLALGPNVTQLNTTALGATVAHPALSTDSFGYVVSGPTPSTFNASRWTVAPGAAYAWTGVSLDWNVFALSGYDQVLDASVLPSLAHSQLVDGTDNGPSGTGTNTVIDFFATYPQRWLRTSPISDGLYFVQDTSLLGIVSTQNGDQSLFAKNRKTHIAYGGFRPNHLLNSGCDRQNILLATDAPAFFGNC